MAGTFKVNTTKRKIALFLSILLAEGIGLLAGSAGMMGQELYLVLQKPVFSPPGWVFPTVWTILYFLMGVAAYRVWLKAREGKDIDNALFLYAIQLILNFLWTVIFFRFQNFGFAFFELLVLFFFIILTTLEFFKVDKKAGYLMILYILWVAFAGILNYSIWILN